MVVDLVAVVTVEVVEGAIAGNQRLLIETGLRSRPYAARAGVSPENEIIRLAACGIEKLTFRLGIPSYHFEGLKL